MTRNRLLWSARVSISYTALAPWPAGRAHASPLPFDSADHLHPGPAGHEAMGSSIDLSLFAAPTGTEP
jgi:phospholipase/lecithinase/hemolysin